jgi:release factor glutamine methyltransferase
MSSTIGALYKEGAASLAAADIDEAEHDARVLLAHVLDVRPNDVLLKAREPVEPLAELVARHLFELRQTRMPLQYVTRTTYFYGLELRSDDRALIPRHETEQLVEAVVERLKGAAVAPGECLADIGCGAGAIGLAIAANLPDWHVVMTDISPGAVELAQENARLVGLADRATLLQGSYLAPLGEADLRSRVGVIVCNPPYVRPGEMPLVSPEVRAEPNVAVESPSKDGMDGYRVLADGISDFPNLRLLAFEVGYAQEEKVAALFAHMGKAEILPDFLGIERVVIIHVG